MLASLLDDLVQRFDGPGVLAIALMGSHARGNAGPFSDVDIVRFTDEASSKLSGSGSHLLGGHLVVVSNASPAEVAKWFSRPEVAVGVIAGVRQAQVLLDRDAYFASIQARAHDFTWTVEMQERANRWASEQLVGWVEEAHKALAGVQSGDVGRLLNGRHGLSWGLSHVMQVQRGVLLSGDNGFYDEVAQAIGAQSEWVQLRRMAFGIEGEDGVVPTLREQVLAGLRLYVMTAEMLASVLHADDVLLITHTIDLIREMLKEE